MRAGLPFCLLFLVGPGSASSRDLEQTYLVSLHVDLHDGESLSEFRFVTWGIDFEAICRIPSGWRIEAGNNAALEGVLRGEGSHGATWLNRKNLGELDKFALVKLYGPVQKAPVYDAAGSETNPVTFAGEGIVGWGGRKIPLSYSNVELIPADHCP